MNTLRLEELDESLKIIGHTHLWLLGDKIPGLPDYFEVVSADGRELAWWCAASRSWFLNREADDITPYSPNLAVAFPAYRALIPGQVFCLGLAFDC